MGRNGQLGLAVSHAESTKRLSSIRALDTDTREHGRHDFMLLIRSK